MTKKETIRTHSFGCSAFSFCSQLKRCFASKRLVFRRNSFADRLLCFLVGLKKSFPRNAGYGWVWLLILAVTSAGCIKHTVEVEEKRVPIHYSDRFYDVAAIDVNNVWVVGFYGKIIHSADGGKTWSIQKSGIMDSLTAVCFANAAEGWVTTLKGEILHTATGGESWELQESGAESALMDVACIDEHHGWTVGAYNTVLRTEDGGNTWLSCGVPEEIIEDATGGLLETGESILNAVCFVDLKQGWVVGEYGMVYQTADGGVTWTKKNEGIDTGNYLFDVYFATPERGWIVAIGGRIFSTTDGGESWLQSSSPTSNALYGIGAANGQLWATGTRGTVITHSGNGWNRDLTPLPSFSWFRGIHFVNDDHGWIVGGAGTVLKTTDGGKAWMAMK